MALKHGNKWYKNKTQASEILGVSMSDLTKQIKEDDDVEVVNLTEVKEMELVPGFEEAETEEKPEDDGPPIIVVEEEPKVVEKKKPEVVSEAEFDTPRPPAGASVKERLEWALRKRI